MSQKIASLYAEIGANITGFEQGAKKVKYGLGDLKSSIKDIGPQLAVGFGIATAALVTMGASIKKVYDIANEGAQLDFTAQRFENLSRSIGTTSDALLTDLRRATRGTLSDMELMASATDLVGLGLAKSRDEAVRLATVAAGLGMNMNQLVLTLTNQTTMRFDALGVSVDGFKEKVAELEKQGMDTNDAFKEAFLQQAEEQLDRVGNAADSTYGSYQRLESQVKSMTDTWKQQTAIALEPIVQKLGDAIQRSNDYEAAVKQSGLSYKDFNIAAREAGMNVNEYTQHILSATSATQDFTQEQENAIEAERENAAAAAELSKTYQGMISDMYSMKNLRESYTEDSTRLKEQEQEIKDEITREALAYSQLRDERQLTQDQIDEHVIKMDELNKSLEDNAQAQQKLTEDTQDAVKQRIADTVLERLEKDELTSQEYEFYQNYLMQQGLITAADRDRAIAVSQAADSIIADYENQNAVTDTTQQKLNALVNGSPYVAQIKIETVGRVPSIGGGKLSNQATNLLNTSTVSRGGLSNMPGFAAGGSFMVPGTGQGDRPYMLNLEPGERVDVTPRGGNRGGVTINITGIVDRQMVNYLAQEITRVQAA